ncbi:hypothetical protein MNY64_18250 (plasmid) [Moellerella wisconsensis]|uniref:hypothetical protein n=1 Tax=Moellerella wisconsensis TaxID=158849 RepID=UPI001F4D9B56|nr:hypothetical protein [Moellerella wisconsensis]UNH29341.1 hypothetical protein MNY64_18250 [Moellerella wisconsensis]
MSSKNFIAFRVDDEIATAIDEAVKQSRMSRSEWLTETVMIRLGMETPETRISIVVDKLEKVVGKLLSESPSKTPQKAHSEVLIEDKPIVQPKPKKTTTTPQGELSEAQLIIIELHNSYSEQGLPKIDHLIAEELNNRGILTPTRKEWDNRVVMNTKTRLKKNGKL